MSEERAKRDFAGGGLKGKFTRANLLIVALTGIGAVVGVLAIEFELGRANRTALERSIRQTLTTKGQSITASQASVFRSLVADTAILEIQNTIARTVEGDSDVLYGVYLSDSGKVWAYCSPASPCAGKQTGDDYPIFDEVEVGRQLALTTAPKTVKSPGVREGTFFGVVALEFYEPVIVDGEPVGTLRYGVSTLSLSRELLAARNAQIELTTRALASFALALLLAIGIGIYFSRRIAGRIVQPLSELTDAAENLARGKHGVEVSIDSGDEVQVLGDTFNRMAADLDSSYRKLEAKNRELQREIDERKRAQHERTELKNHLLQAQKMEAFGQLAGGVAHDFNNILAVVIGNSELAGQTLEDEGASEEVRRFVQDIGAAADRGANLTRQLLTFSRREADSPKLVHLNDTLRNFTKLIRRVLEESVELRLEAKEGIPRVQIDPGRLEQVLMNLCVNARDAMPDGGRITLRTSEIVLAKAKTCATGVLEPGSYVVLEASDTGTGIPSDVAPRIFEPFFTTKAAGQGTGLGLAMVHSIVQAAAGAIDIDTRSGIGTTFVVYLPAYADADGFELGNEANIAGKGKGHRVLLCEDEAPVRQMTKRMLERNGYRVHDAATPRAALDLLKEHNFDLLLTDVVMPGMNGKELADEAHKLSPDLPVLYVSGYTAGILSAHGISDDSTCFLRKPFRSHELLGRISELIERVESDRGVPSRSERPQNQ